MTILYSCTAIGTAGIISFVIKRKKQLALETSPYRFLASSQGKFNNFRKKKRW